VITHLTENLIVYAVTLCASLNRNYSYHVR